MWTCKCMQARASVNVQIHDTGDHMCATCCISYFPVFFFAEHIKDAWFECVLKIATLDPDQSRNSSASSTFFNSTAVLFFLSFFDPSISVFDPCLCLLVFQRLQMDLGDLAKIELICWLLPPSLLAQHLSISKFITIPLPVCDPPRQLVHIRIAPPPSAAISACLGDSDTKTYVCACLWKRTHARMHARSHARAHARMHTHNGFHDSLLVRCVDSFEQIEQEKHLRTNLEHKSNKWD